MSSSSVYTPLPVEHLSSSVDEALNRAAQQARMRQSSSAPHALATAREALEQNWERIVSAATLVSAWELPKAPRLRDVPDQYWGAYAEWLFAYPENPSAADLPAIAAHLAARVEEIADWMERNYAATPIRVAVAAYLRTPPPPLAGMPRILQLRIQQARARILIRAQGGRVGVHLVSTRRDKRPLRVGVLHSRFDHRPETFATYARCASLDPRRVELHLFAGAPAFSPIENRCRDIAFAFEILPEHAAEQLAVLQGHKLDVLIYADDLSAHPLPAAQLALFRAAPLQIATGSLTTGLPAMDLLLTGAYDDAACHPHAFSERLAVLPETAQAWDLSADRPDDALPWDRATLGLEADQPCVVSRAGLANDAAVLARWPALLTTVPGAALLFVPSPGQTDLDHARQAVAATNDPSVRLHEPAPLDHAEMASLLALADLAIDLDGPAAILALEAGVPLLAVAGSPNAALLKSAGLTGLIFTDLACRDAEVVRLLADADARARLRETVEQAMMKLPRFADFYAAAADFTLLLETAWDELCTLGRRGMMHTRAPLHVATPHSLHPGDLQSEGRTLIAAGCPERAVPCLLSAIQRAEGDAALWFDLARAYRAADLVQPAIESLEASLRLDEANAAGWIMLCELAAAAGLSDLAREALDVAARLRPDDENLAELRSGLDA
ncbi:MAG: hypothetical protein WC661_03550 [Opitutaceae bacterium]|jgi:predicted O-linked N-acetylglucosamine transferase (SPINDLY family)